MNNRFSNLPKELQSLAEGVLKRVEKHDGEWSWYQLDRSLSYDDNLPVIHRLLEVIKDLEADNLIRAEMSNPNSDPTYWLTENGRTLLQQN